MSLPIGAKWIYESGRKVGVRLQSGNTVSRGEGERLGARESGYKNPNQEKTNTAKRNSFLRDSKAFNMYKDRARAEAKTTKTRFDPRTISAAYWRSHVAGLNYYSARGRSDERELQLELQRAMTALGRLTGNAGYTWPKSGDTP